MPSRETLIACGRPNSGGPSGVGLRLRHGGVRRERRRRRVAERAPHPLELAGLGVEHDRRAGCRSRRRRRPLSPRVSTNSIGGLVDVFGVGVALALPAVADLHDELAGHRELQDHVVAGAGRGRPRPAARVRRSRRSYWRRRRCRARVRASRARRRSPPQLVRSLPAASNSSTGGAAFARCASGIDRGTCSTQM